MLPKALNNKRILICRPDESATELANTFSALGAECRIFPTLEICSVDIPPEQKQRILSLDQYRYVIVTSQHAAKAGLTLIDAYWPQFPIDQIWLAIGSKTASILKNETIKLVAPDKDFTSETLLKLPLLQKVKDEKILILKGKEGRDTLQNVLDKRGAKVDIVELYERKCPAYSKEQVMNAVQEFDARYLITLSGETLQNLFSLCAEHNINLSSKTFVVPSHRVANIAYEAGFKSVLVPTGLKPIDLIKSITNHKNT